MRVYIDNQEIEEQTQVTKFSSLTLTSLTRPPCARAAAAPAACPRTMNVGSTRTDEGGMGCRKGDGDNEIDHLRRLGQHGAVGDLVWADAAAFAGLICDETTQNGSDHAMFVHGSESLPQTLQHLAACAAQPLPDFRQRLSKALSPPHHKMISRRLTSALIRHCTESSGSKTFPCRSLSMRYGVSEIMNWEIPRSSYFRSERATSSAVPTSQVVPAAPPPWRAGAV